MKFYESEFAKKWFSWLEWVTITAAIWAIGENGQSLLVSGVAYFSAIIVMANAWATFDNFIDKNFPNPKKLPRVAVHILSTIIVVLPLTVMYFVGTIIKSMLES
ncbi:hypothetical protein [Cycloclasticus pugetii]|uniref:hypothetical protein n=1 Tax=Cycloclasticus pugetii TaxID=34068 RepID=UPI003A942033